MPRLLRRLVPGVPDVVFGVVLVMVLIGGRQQLLNDPGTFWHLQLGRDIVATGTLPQVDTLTYTKAGAHWVNPYWAFDLGLAVVVDRWGWSGAVAIAALVLATLYGVLARQLVLEGRSAPTAAVVAILAAGIGAIHFLVRPHLLTFVFVFYTYWSCQGYHRRSSRAVWTIPIVMVLWANVHGGFLAGPVIVATAWVGHAISPPRDAVWRRRLLGFGSVLVLSVLAPLVNPYGLDLYRHVLHLLFGSGVTALIQEHQPAPFGDSKAKLLELVILAFVALPVFTRERPTRYEMTYIVVWLHLALGSIRHAPLFAFAAASGLARLMDGVMSPPKPGEQPMLSSRWSLWPIVAAGGLAWAVGSGVCLGELDSEKWPTRSIAVLNRQPVEARLFHEQDWGGLIASESRPRRQAFLDDRFELHGRDRTLAYLRALRGGPGWDTLDDEYRFELVWIRPDRDLAERLAEDPDWEEIDRDGVSVLFRRVGSAGP